MDSIFNIKNSKELYSLYKSRIKNIENTKLLVNSYRSSFLDILTNYDNSGYFDSVVAKDFSQNKINSNNFDKCLDLVNTIYYYNKCLQISNSCIDMLSRCKDDLQFHLKNLFSNTNFIFKLFSSKDRKNESEKSFIYLNEYLNSGFYTITSSALNQLSHIKEEPQEAIFDDVCNNLSKYKDIFISVYPFYGKDVATIIKKVSDKFNQIKNYIDKVKKDCSSEQTESLIKNSIDKLVANELISILKSIPLDELNRDKSKIRVKSLIDGGYNNMADVYSSTISRLASVYGISYDMACTIKRISDNYASKAFKDIKIKLSADNKNTNTSNVVKNVYILIKKRELKNKIDGLSNQYYHDVENSILNLLSIGNGSIYLFSSLDEKENLLNDYQQTTNIINEDFLPNSKRLHDQYFNLKIGVDDAWSYFSSNSIEFYNIIEEVCPGVLGNDDSLYGLPEELAREIQDECYFPDGLLVPLRRYQEWGVKYILHQERALLGDEMGLGKTIQAIATMVSLKNTGATHFVVVCPASVVTNWCREINSKSRLKAIKVHGNMRMAALNSWIKTGGVAVTTYETTQHFELPDNFRFSLLVVDEAHYIKNGEARRSINTKNLANFADRLLFMTGTALENNVDEMINLINVLNPEIASQVSGIAFMSSAPQFREKIAPVYYRRKRKDVLTELPELIETKEWCPLNPEEEEKYEDCILFGSYASARRVSWNIDDLNKSSKATRLMEIIQEAEGEGRKIIVFSFFLDTIYKLYEFLKGRCSNPITGSVNPNRRQEIIDEFDKAPAGSVLLAQIMSGGTGLNIQSASVVIICEPQFKPSIENQAISRAYRMGQSRNVLVYRLLCEDTIDERITDLLEEKQAIFDAFADKSVAAQKSIEIDDNSFGNIIKDEIDRINKKRGNKTENITNQNTDYYKKLLNYSYSELCDFLISKYGPSKCDYFKDESCSSKNKEISRSKEGLFCHHIDEDKAIMLSHSEYAIKNPFEYQKASHLVYCNFLEHLILHTKIVEEPRNPKSNKNELLGIGGALNFICKQLNGFYNGDIFVQEHLSIASNLIKNDFDSYILILKKLWKAIQNNPELNNTKLEELCMDWKNNKINKIYDLLK